MQKFRKFWMTYTAVLTIVSMAMLVVQQISLIGNYYLPMASVAISLGGIYIYYRCAFKKPGTKYLTFALISCGIGGVFMIYRTFTISPFSVSLALQTVSTIVWFVLTLKMRATNRILAQQV
ncbi:MAG: hypothetical protein P0S94_05595 [Simkaniaceae bacterium]|nr:hypothetical protein [Simkaniaceae bacterium]